MAWPGQRLGRTAGRQRNQGPLDRRLVGRIPDSGLGQSPVDDQGLAVTADDHVARLDIAVQYTPAVGILDRVADVGESAEKLVKWRATGGRGRLQALDRRGTERSPA